LKFRETKNELTSLAIPGERAFIFHLQYKVIIGKSNRIDGTYDLLI
jgi:hypothetical protein